MRGIGQITVTQEPRAEPVHLDEAKNHLRVSIAADDALIAALVNAARVRAEAILQRALVLQTLELAFDCFHDVFRLDRSPIMKFGAVQYRDFAGVLQTLSTSIYQVDKRSEPGRLTRAYAQVWPQIRGGEDLHSVLITYQAGYLAPATLNVNDTLTVEDNPFANDEKVYVSNSGGTIATGLTAHVPYYVVQTAGNAFKLSLTVGGAAVDITAIGSGQHYVSRRRFPDAIKQAQLLMIGHWYENREDTIVGTIIQPLPQGVEALLAPYRLQAFS